MHTNDHVTTDGNSNSAAEFEDKIRRYSSSLYKSAWRLTGSRNDAEDLTQELLIKLYRQYPEWRSMDRPMPWILRVLYNLHIDMHRRKAYTHGVNADTLDTQTSPDSLESATASPHAEAEGNQRQQRILSALDQLAPEQRALVTLHLIEGHTLQEVAVILDTPLGTLKSRLHRCKAQLKKSLRLEPFFKNPRI